MGQKSNDKIHSKIDGDFYEKNHRVIVSRALSFTIIFLQIPREHDIVHFRNQGVIHELYNRNMERVSSDL
jgi:hypothetical protein